MNPRIINPLLFKFKSSWDGSLASKKRWFVNQNPCFINPVFSEVTHLGLPWDWWWRRLWQNSWIRWRGTGDSNNICCRNAGVSAAFGHWAWPYGIQGNRPFFIQLKQHRWSQQRDISTKTNNDVPIFLFCTWVLINMLYCIFCLFNFNFCGVGYKIPKQLVRRWIYGGVYRIILTLA